MDKTVQIKDNLKLSQKVYASFMNEFNNAKYLNHPNLGDYNYFFSKYDLASKTYEFHLIIKTIKGSNLNDTILKS